MELPLSLREMNPVLDEIARGEYPVDGPALRLAVALGLATPDLSLTEAGWAYARPALAAGPLSLVMGPERRTAAEPLLSGPMPLQRSLRRLLLQVSGFGGGLVAPASLGWPEPLLRPYLTYLEDLGLLVSIGPMVEVTHRGMAAAAAAPAEDKPSWPDLTVPEHNYGTPTFTAPVFRYYLVRQIALTLLSLRGRREWHLLQPLLDGPFAVLKPAYQEWLGRFQATQPSTRRSWTLDLVERFAARDPAPDWFDRWCHALLGTGPERAAEVLAQSPALLRDPAVLTAGPPDRETWLVAVAIQWSTRRGRGLRYAEAAARFAADGFVLPPLPEMQVVLEKAGLLLTADAELKLLLPVDVQPPVGTLWPYASADWVAAALMEGGAFAPAGGQRRAARM